MPSARAASARYVPTIPKAPAAPAAPAVPAFSPVSRPAVPAPLPDGTARINAAGEQNIFDQFGTLDDRFKFDRVRQSADLKAMLEGLNFKFTDNADGSVNWEEDERPGTRQRQAIQNEKNQGNARGQLYSSFTDQAIGDALTRMSTAAQDALRQYGGNIKRINDNYLAEANSLSGRLTELITDDAKWAVTNYIPPTLPEPEVPKRWVGSVNPNVETLAQRWGVPVDQIRITRSGPKSGNKFVATLKTG